VRFPKPKIDRRHAAATQHCPTTPPEKMMECMGGVRKVPASRARRTAISGQSRTRHVQFETIHPFLDGNGRLGRLLITFLLCVAGAIREPILYLSLYFKTNRQKYYELLDRVRSHGDWETWLEFFLTGVKDNSSTGGRYFAGDTHAHRTDRRKQSRRLADRLRQFCAFISTFRGSRSSRSRRQPSSSPSLRPPVAKGFTSTW